MASRAEFGLEVFLLARPDTVLADTGPPIDALSRSRLLLHRIGCRILGRRTNVRVPDMFRMVRIDQDRHNG